MSGSTRARVVRSVGATGFGLIVTLAVQAVSVPVFLHGFGVHRYGEWLVLSAVPAYLTLSDLGFMGVVGNEMTMRVAVDDHDGAQAAFQTVWAAITALSAGVAAAALTAVWLLPSERLVHAGPNAHAEVAATLTLLAGTVLTWMQMQMLEAGFRCVGLFPRGNLGLSVVRLVWFGATAAAALAGAGLVGTAGAQLGASVFGFGALRLRMRKDVPWLRFGIAAFSRVLLRRLVSPAIAYLGLPVGNALALQGMVLIVSAELGPAAVVVLTVVRTVAGGIRQLVNVVCLAVWPELSRAIAAKELPLARRLHVASLRTTITLAVGCGLVLVAAGQPLIHVWTGSVVRPSPMFLRLMLLTVALDVVWLSSLVVLASVNRHQRAAILYLASSAIALGLAAALVPVLGLPAVPLALLTSDFVVTGYVIRASTTLLRQSLGDFGRQLVGVRAPHPREEVAL